MSILRLTLVLGFSLLTVCIAALVGFAFWFSGGSHQAPPFHSPDGRFEAIAEGDRGSALDMGHVKVEVRCLRDCDNTPSTQAYSGPGFYYPPQDGRAQAIDPAIQWLDTTHLRIQYDDGPSGRSSCGTVPRPAVLVCEPAPASVPVKEISPPK